MKNKIKEQIDRYVGKRVSVSRGNISVSGMLESSNTDNIYEIKNSTRSTSSRVFFKESDVDSTFEIASESKLSIPMIFLK